MGEIVRGRSGDREQDICFEWGGQDADRNYAASVWLGRRGHVDSGETAPSSLRQGGGWGIPEVLVPARAFEARRFPKGGGCGSDGGGEAACDGVPEGLPEALHGAYRIIDESGRGEIQDDAVYRAGGGGIVAADRLRERGELAAGAGDHEREGVCDSVGAGSEPVETDPAAFGGEPDPGDWGGGSGDTAGVGRAEIAGSADAAGHHSGGSSDSPEYTGIAVCVGSGSDDGAGVWAGAGVEGGAQGY